jgi:PST family polysaccharide transporter
MRNTSEASPGTSSLGLSDTSSELPRTPAGGDLDKVLVRGVAWTAAIKWLSQVFTWGTTVVVARVLIPADYGLVGMAALYINLLTLFSEFGIGNAVVTLQDLTGEQLSQLNFLSLFVGLIGFLLSASGALLLGKFFRAPNLPLVVVVLSFGFVISGLRTVPYSLLQKELRFKLLAFIEGLQAIIQALITLILALLGFGYWALVLGILSFSVTPTCLTLFWRRQSFAIPKLSSIRKAVHYSRRILIGRLCWASYDNSDFIVAGKVLGEAPLGAYTLAWTLAQTPLEKLTTLINRVTPSVFAKIQSDSAALRRYLLNISGFMALVVFPAVIGVALVADEFVPVILGPKWNGAILPLELLAFHALIRSNVILLTPLLNAIGEERSVMWNSIIAMIVLPITFYVGSHWGTAGIALGWVTVYPLLQFPLFFLTFRRVNLTASEYLGALWPALSSCALMAFAILALKSWHIEIRYPYLHLGFEIIIGIAVYGASLILFHSKHLSGTLQFVRTSG